MLNLFVFTKEKTEDAKAVVIYDDHMPSWCPLADYDKGKTEAYIRPATIEEIQKWLANKANGNHYEMRLYTPIDSSVARKCRNNSQYKWSEVRVAAEDTESSFLATRFAIAGGFVPTMYVEADTIWH